MKRSLALLPALLLLPSLTFAADKEVEDLLAKMRESYKAVKTCKYTVKAKLSGGPMGEVEVTADVTYKTGNMIYGKATGLPGSTSTEVIFKSDGKKISIEGAADQKIEDDFSLDAVSQGFPGNLESLCFWDYERQLSTGPDGNMKTSTFKIVKEEKWNDKDWLVLEETAQEQGVFCRYFIDPKTNFIWHTVVTTIEGGEQLQDCTLANLEIDPEVDEKLFEIG